MSVSGLLIDLCKWWRFYCCGLAFSKLIIEWSTTARAQENSRASWAGSQKLIEDQKPKSTRRAKIRKPTNRRVPLKTDWNFGAPRRNRVEAIYVISVVWKKPTTVHNQDSLALGPHVFASSGKSHWPHLNGVVPKLPKWPKFLYLHDNTCFYCGI